MFPCIPLQHSKPEARNNISNSCRVRPFVTVALGVRDVPIGVTPKDRDLVIVGGDGTYRSSEWCFYGGEFAFWEK